MILAIVLLAYFIGAPELKGAPNPASIDVSPQPDWYLLWIFALFALMPPEIESYVMFLGPILLVGILLALPFISNKGERHPMRRPWSIAGVIMTITFVGTLWHEGIQAPWSPDFKAKPLTLQKSEVSQHEELVKGAKLFYDNGCLYCHKINSYGGMRGPDLTNIEKRLNENQMIVRIVNGGKNMPAFGGSLTKDELSALIVFLKNEKKDFR